jgi:hypothetical protein
MQVSLESYEAERADFARVVAAIRTIGCAPMAELSSVDWLVEVIRSVGLVPIPDFETAFHGEEDYVNASQQGLIQIPREFARYLALLGEHRPASYLEIGCFNGVSACLATAYLARFHPAFRATTIDVWPAFLFYDEVRALIPLEYRVAKTSFDFRDAEAFEAVFIDGDHSFDWAWADYQNVGRRARLCAFHDIRNAPYLDLPLGGICAVWEALKREERDSAFHEFAEHPTRELMGIGVRVKNT